MGFRHVEVTAYFHKESLREVGLGENGVKMDSENWRRGIEYNECNALLRNFAIKRRFS